MRTPLTALLVLLLASPAFGTKYTVDDPLQRDTVTFRLESALESIEGRSSSLKGFLDLNENNLEASKGGEFTLPTKSLSTGIGLRDQHMFDTYLNVDRFPDMKFIVSAVEAPERARGAHNKTIKAIKLSEKEKVPVVLKGDLYLHGVKRAISIPADLIYFKESNLTQAKLKGNLVVIRAEFEAKLEDFLIHRTHIVSMQVGDAAHVNVFATATTQPRAEIAPPK